MKIDWEKIKRIGITLAAVLGFLLGVVNYINSQFPVNVESLGVTNFDSITLSGDLNAANVTATTITATTLISQAVGFAGVNATLTGDLQGRNITATGTISSILDLRARAITATATISSAGAADFHTLAIAGVTISGSVHYGYVASEASGAAISHGFPAAPTACVVTPMLNGGSAVSATVGGPPGALTFTVTMASTGPLFWMCGQ